MSEWHFRVEAMIPWGSLEDKLFVFKISGMDRRVSVMHTATLTETESGGIFPMERALMTAHHPFTGKSEIDDFLQAAMECAWARGLRPAKFDPSAGELAAVQAHLQDMRRLVRADPPAVTVDEKAAEYLGDIGPGEDKKW
jgi:hypothetical protein